MVYVNAIHRCAGCTLYKLFVVLEPSSVIIKNMNWIRVHWWQQTIYAYRICFCMNVIDKLHEPIQHILRYSKVYTINHSIRKMRQSEKYFNHLYQYIKIQWLKWINVSLWQQKSSTTEAAYIYICILCALDLIVASVVHIVYSASRLFNRRKVSSRARRLLVCSYGIAVLFLQFFKGSSSALHNARSSTGHCVCKCDRFYQDKGWLAAAWSEKAALPPRN